MTRYPRTSTPTRPALASFGGVLLAASAALAWSAVVGASPTRPSVDFCVGDLDGSGRVDIVDLGILGGEYGASDCQQCIADMRKQHAYPCPRAAAGETAAGTVHFWFCDKPNSGIQHRNLLRKPLSMFRCRIPLCRNARHLVHRRQQDWVREV